MFCFPMDIRETKPPARLQPDAYTSAGKHRSDIAYFHIQMEAFDPI